MTAIKVYLIDIALPSGEFGPPLGRTICRWDEHGPIDFEPSLLRTIRSLFITRIHQAGQHRYAWGFSLDHSIINSDDHSTIKP